MDLGKKYRIMCYKSQEIQDKWTPTEGDFMLSLASYCDCNKESICDECLEMDNVYVISGEYSFVEEVGGKHWLYGGTPCVRGDGNRLNDTYCFTMTRTGYSEITNEFYRSSVKDHLWLPRQDQIQDMLLKGLANVSKLVYFTQWLKTATYNPHTYSMEMLWLMYYMEEVHNKKWNAFSNVMNWEEIGRVQYEEIQG